MQVPVVVQLDAERQMMLALVVVVVINMETPQPSNTTHMTTYILYPHSG